MYIEAPTYITHIHSCPLYLCGPLMDLPLVRAKNFCTMWGIEREFITVIVRHFGKYFYPLSWGELDEKINTTLVPVQ